MADGSARVRAVAASVVAHAGVFGVLVWGLSRQPGPPPERIMQVELAAPFPRRAPETPERRSGRREAHSVLRPHVTPPNPTAPPATPVPPAATTPGIRRALRGLVGCERAELLGLSEAERERCRERLAAGVETTPKLALKRAGEFQTDDVPYLNRKPKNGCKPGIGGSEPIMGQSGVTGGIGCAWSF